MLVPQSRISAYVAPSFLQHSSEHDRRNRVGGRALISLPFFHATPLPGLMAFFKFLPFRMQLFQKHTLHKSQCNLSRFMVLFLYFFFLILLFGHLGDQCAFGLVVLVSLCLCISFPPLPHHNSVRLPPFRCSCAGPGELAIVRRPMYASTRLML
jgi:hypothetical protein